MDLRQILIVAAVITIGDAAVAACVMVDNFDVESSLTSTWDELRINDDGTDHKLGTLDVAQPIELSVSDVSGRLVTRDGFYPLPIAR